ncbi:hypothetical protein BZL29_8534 [Mycobacterium kansasii]|uniref:Uncharacterized protein n=1 Tax=Mycobacterium kansasii TaxID=1768 RepID=A0A1V3W8R1_MYCKA|nr:hypothetical protein BZL29_8534 [Mycobacterium kansasii]
MPALQGPSRPFKAFKANAAAPGPRTLASALGCDESRSQITRQVNAMTQAMVDTG